MGLNLLLIAIGLVICFGGIYIRKVCSAFLGLIWGALCSFAVILMSVGLWGIDEESFYIVAVCAVVFAIISCIHDKLCAAINAFLSTFFLVAILLLLADSAEGTMLIQIAGVVALVVSLISIRIYDYSFILTTAFSGAFIASIGFCGVIYDSEASDVLMELLFGDEVTGIIIAVTIVLGIIGFFVQFQRIKKRKSATTIKEQIVMEEPSRNDDEKPEVKRTPLFEGFEFKEIKENWILILAPVLVSIIWPIVISPILQRVFPSMFFYMYKDRLLYFIPDIIVALISGFAMATLIISVEHRSKGFCFIWMIPSILAAAMKVWELFGYLPYSSGQHIVTLIVLYLKDVLVYLLPLMLWKILPRIGKAYYSDTQKTLKSCLITALYVILIREAIEVALYSVAMLLVNGTVWYEAMFGSICITVLEIVVAAFVLKKLSAPYANTEPQDC